MLNILNNEIKNEKHKQVAVFFSGGIDSSLIAKLVSKYSDVTCYTAGIKGSKDIKFAEKAAKAMDLKWVKIELDENKIKNIVKKLNLILQTSNCELQTTNFVDIGVGTVIFACCEKCKEKTAYTGMGADELFLGYHRFKSMNKKELEIESKKSIEKVLSHDRLRDKKICDCFGIKLKTPFLSNDFVEESKKLGTRHKISKTANKIILRKMCKEIGIPDFICSREKKAAQYGSGVNKVIQKAKLGV